MWVVHAGNRIDANNRESPRFPAHNVVRFEARLHRFLGELRPTGVVSAASGGADLLVLDVARSLGLRTEVVLPLPVDEFLRQSVVDQGSAWLERFDRVLPDRSAAVVHDLSGYEDWYLRGNDRILEHAERVAGEEGLLAVAVRPPPDIARPSATDDFVRRAHHRGLTVIDLDPGRANLPSAFAVMPFGTKPDPSRPGVKIDCDETFRKLIVPLLEDADFDWTRADRSVESGFVHVGMLEQLANADFVIVDLTLENTNVLYELGIRHALRDRATLMIHRRGGAAMFDLRPLRESRFELAGSAITDHEALTAIAEIAPAVQLACTSSAPIDSPLHTLFEVSPTPTIRARSGTVATDHFAELDDRLAQLERAQLVNLLDARLGPEALSGLVTDIEAARVDPASTKALLFRLAVLLRASGRYRDALRVHGRPALGGSGKESNVTSIEVLKERALCHHRLGAEAAEVGGDPEQEWARAAELLVEALSAPWTTADTYGVAAGLEKRRADRAIRSGDRAVAKSHLKQAAAYYHDGTRLDPTDYYLLLNRTTTLRLLGQYFDEPEYVDQARELLPVAFFFAHRANETDRRDSYAAASLGELAYTRLRLSPKTTDSDRAFHEAEERYAEAIARGVTSDQRRAMASQLEIYERLDGPDERLAAIRRRIAGA